MAVEFLILIGVFGIMLEQIRRLRALAAQQKADYEAQLSVLRNTIAEMHNATEPLEVQAELDAFEAELTPASTVEVEAVRVG